MNIKLILFTLITLSCGISNARPDQRTIQMYRSVPEWTYEDNVVLPFILSMAALFAKETHYEFQKYEDDDLIVFTVYNHECSFCLQFNTTTRVCTIEFNALDETFDYTSFKKMIDFFFINS